VKKRLAFLFKQSSVFDFLLVDYFFFVLLSIVEYGACDPVGETSPYWWSKYFSGKFRFSFFYFLLLISLFFHAVES